MRERHHGQEILISVSLSACYYTSIRGARPVFNRLLCAVLFVALKYTASLHATSTSTDGISTTMTRYSEQWQLDKYVLLSSRDGFVFFISLSKSCSSFISLFCSKMLWHEQRCKKVDEIRYTIQKWISVPSLVLVHLSRL